MSRSDVAAVVIGRNEAVRLGLCLRALGDVRTVYVDSGSTDGSPAIAREAGVEVIELAREGGWSAARARNAGLDRVTADPAIAYVQMVDGDCEIAPGWIAAGAAALDADPALGGVFGRLREVDPDASIYAWLCDVEWAVPAGPASVFGGLVLLRAAAVRGSDGYRDDMIAGEDPDYALRLRAAGWRLLALPDAMAEHDAGITRFGQWWRRTLRGGHAFADLNRRHAGSTLHDFARNRRRIVFWGGAVPGVALAGLLLALGGDARWLILPALALALVVAQMLRGTLRERRRYGLRRAAVLALFLAVGKYAEMLGLIRFQLSRPRAR